MPSHRLKRPVGPPPSEIGRVNVYLSGRLFWASSFIYTMKEAQCIGTGIGLMAERFSRKYRVEWLANHVDPPVIVSGA